jgi:hypothetical protein
LNPRRQPFQGCALRGTALRLRHGVFAAPTESFMPHARYRRRKAIPERSVLKRPPGLPVNPGQANCSQSMIKRRLPICAYKTGRGLTTPVPPWPLKEQPCKKEASFALHVDKEPMFGSTAGENLVPEKQEDIAESSLARSTHSKMKRQPLKAIASIIVSGNSRRTMNGRFPSQRLEPLQ